VSNGPMTAWQAPSGRSLKQRIERLEADLHPEVRINAYHDQPYAVFRYDPAEELAVRPEIQMLKTRLEKKGKQILLVSLAEVVNEALDSALSGNLERFYKAEVDQGVEAAVKTVHQILTKKRPLDQLVAERLNALDPANSIAFLVRAEALYPAYRTSALLDRLSKTGVRVPVVLFYPGTLEGVSGLKFMGALEPEHNYRARIY